jgi:hypothetical protein
MISTQEQKVKTNASLIVDVRPHPLPPLLEGEGDIGKRG